MARPTFTSTRGAVFATAGVAIGLGNIWRFPYMMGKYGGVLFLLAYIVIIVAFGVPALMAEWALGRHTRRGTWGAFQGAGLSGGRMWSGLLLLTVIMAASYYGVVLAFVLNMAVGFAQNTLGSTASDAMPSLATDFCLRLGYVVITVGLGCGSLYFGVRTGIEKVSGWALPAFFGLFVVLIVRVLTLDGAMQGVREFLVPRWEDFSGATALAALGQAFFSLGLGGTFMVVYGSYLREQENIPRTAVLTATADLAAALMGAMVVVPAAFAFSISLSSGPRLMFEVMPHVFHEMPGGGLFGVAFFGGVFLVAMLSLMAAYEVVVSAATDGLGWTRGRTLLVLAVLQVVLAVPALLVVSYIEYSDLVWGSTMQPVGGAIAVLALTWSLGRAKALGEIRRNSGAHIPDWLFYWLKYGLPLGILVTLVYGWADTGVVQELWNRFMG